MIKREISSKGINNNALLELDDTGGEVTRVTTSKQLKLTKTRSIENLED